MSNQQWGECRSCKCWQIAPEAVIKNQTMGLLTVNLDNNENSDMIKILKTQVLCLIILGLVSACSTVHKPTQSPRAAVEQLLLSEAVIKSLPNQLESALPIPQGAKVVVDTTGTSEDKDIVRQIMAGWLGKQGYEVMAGWFGEEGYHVQGDINVATHRINVNVGALGTELGETFIGLPPIQSVVIPFATPELALFKAQYQTGFVKMYLDIYELPSNRFIKSTSPFFAETYYNDYTAFFLFSWKKTDLIPAPQLGGSRKSADIRERGQTSSEESP